jgi:hypothetical protein
MSVGRRDVQVCIHWPWWPTNAQGVRLPDIGPRSFFPGAFLTIFSNHSSFIGVAIQILEARFLRFLNIHPTNHAQHPRSPEATNGRSPLLSPPYPSFLANIRLLKAKKELDMAHSRRVGDHRLTVSLHPHLPNPRLAMAVL